MVYDIEQKQVLRYVTVKEFIDILRKVDPDRKVCIDGCTLAYIHVSTDGSFINIDANPHFMDYKRK